MTQSKNKQHIIDQPNNKYDPALKTRNAANYLSQQPSTLDNWRHERKGPEYTKVNGTIYYRLSALNRFLAGENGDDSDD